MADSDGERLFKDLQKISEYYFGPATYRVLTSQIRHHLKKPPEKITRKDILKLAVWLGLSLSVVNGDKTEIEQYLRKVRKLK